MAAAVAVAPTTACVSLQTLSRKPEGASRYAYPSCQLGSLRSPVHRLHGTSDSSFNGRQIKLLNQRQSCQPATYRVPSASLGNFFNRRSDEKDDDASAPSPFDEDNRLREAVAIRLTRAAGEFRRWGNWGFWVQLVTAVVSAVILAFSVAITGQATNAISAYLTAGGIVAAFISVFRSFGYTRLARQFEESADDPDRAPRRTDTIRQLKNGIVLNMVGLAATLLGAQATVGLLVAKALTSQNSPYLANTPQGFSPVLALDVFLIQASFNVVTAHFFGLLFQLLLLSSTTTSPPPPESVLPKPA